MKKSSRKKASLSFTMVELTIVLAVLAVIIAVTLIYLNPSQQIKKARDVERKAGLNEFRTALQAYSVVNGGTYPEVVSAEPETDASTLLCTALSTYLSECPVDPQDEGFYGYYYYVNDTQTQAALYTPLEGKDDTLWVVCADGTAGLKPCDLSETYAGRLACVSSFCAMTIPIPTPTPVPPTPTPTMAPSPTAATPPACSTYTRTFSTYTRICECRYVSMCTGSYYNPPGSAFCPSPSRCCCRNISAI